MNQIELNEALDTVFNVVTILQFLIPGFLTFLVATLKLIGFIFVPTPWILILLPLMVSVSVGIGLIAIILLTKLFMKAFGEA
jgi:hypothetical protein